MQADLLKEIQIVLQCKDSKLIDLPQDAVIIDNSRDEDVTLADWIHWNIDRLVERFRL
jgi:hypothetical protein